MRCAPTGRALGRIRHPRTAWLLPRAAWALFAPFSTGTMARAPPSSADKTSRLTLQRCGGPAQGGERCPAACPRRVLWRRAHFSRHSPSWLAGAQHAAAATCCTRALATRILRQGKRLCRLSLAPARQRVLAPARSQECRRESGLHTHTHTQPHTHTHTHTRTHTHTHYIYIYIYVCTHTHPGFRVSAGGHRLFGAIFPDLGRRLD